jgi:hypothetical protein
MSNHRDLQELSELRMRYATGIDRRDRALLRAVFTDDRERRDGCTGPPLLQHAGVEVGTWARSDLWM